MTFKRRAVLIFGPLLAALLVAPVPVRADGGAPARIRDVRVGEHSGFERLVIELDSEVEVVWENGPEPGEESFYIAAAPAQASRVISTQLPHMGTVSITEMKGGTHVAIEPRERRVRAYTMTNPPRLVIDFAAPAQDAFVAPAGARAIEPAQTLGPLVLEPEPESEPAPATEPAPVPEPVPEPTATPEPEPAPKLAEEPAKPLPKPMAATKPAVVAPEARTPGSGFPYGLALGALLGLALLVAAGVMFARRRAARAEIPPSSDFSEEDDDEIFPTRVDEISPAEILAAGDHEALLEMRLDEEVRARLELEQRFAQANEELKVLRDRLHRLERRREGAV